jgi:TolB-like protein
MKKAILSLLLVFTAGIVFGQTVVVIPFNTRGQTLTRDDAASITELFIAELAKQSGVRVVDRTSLDRVVREMRFQNTDWSNPQKTAQLGASLNAEFLVRGQLNQLGQQISVAITAFDIKTLEVVSSSTNTFNVDKIFDNTTRDSFGYRNTNNIFDQMPYMAKNIADPIKTKMEELARQRQEQEQEQAQNRYSLIGTWSRGATTIAFRANGVSDVNYINNGTDIDADIWTFFGDGTVRRQYVDRTSSSVTRIEASGHYTRQNNRIEFSLSGTELITTAINHNRRTGKYEYFTERSNNYSYSDQVSIEFRNNGRELIMGNTRLLKQ